jgi:peptidoglycan/LPS O-acetylase OafA/YrhL
MDPSIRERGRHRIRRGWRTRSSAGYNPGMRAGRSRLPELDAMRGLAALAVVLFHFNMARSADRSPLNLGVTGVDLFFIISGFVILLTLERSASLREFALNRVSRLYPAYWICVSLTAALAWAFGRTGASFPGYLANLTMFQRYLGVADLDGPYWTLAVELCFYAAMALLFAAKRLHAVEGFAIAALALAFAYRGSFAWERLGLARVLIRHWLPLIDFIPLFVSGIFFQRVLTAGPSPARYAVIAACFACQALLFPTAGMSHFYVDPPQYLGMLAAYFALFILFVHGKLAWLANGVTLFLGNISYSLYLCHQFLGYRVLMPRLMGYGMGFWPACGIALAVVVALAAGIAYGVERPALRYARSRFTSARRPESSGTDTPRIRTAPPARPDRRPSPRASLPG